MIGWRTTWICVMLLGWTGAAPADDPAVGPEPDPQAVEFFEREVRPVLLASCIECHGPETQESDLRLDTAQAMLRGAANGPVVVPGNPESSRLVAAIRYDGDIQMPPTARLPDKSITALTRWIEMGAPWPSTAAQLTQHSDATQHWAFQPVSRPDPPTVHQPDWVQTPVDQFILARLESAGLEPNAPADRHTLLRRLTFDLTGLPPTANQVAEYVGDNDPGATRALIDRLLESPQFGERWARYWLDIARYSDTKGYVFTEDRSYKYAYVYRDWLIRAFNDDMPFDKFLMCQLAGDRLCEQGETAPLAAMGFLTVGRRFLNNQHDIIDDRIDVVTRGMMGLTVACARCHDHKYDPIPTADYYSLYGVFSASRESMLPIEEASDEFEAELKKREAEAQAHLETRRDELRSDMLKNPGRYLAAGWDGKYAAHDPEYWKRDDQPEIPQRVAERWKNYLNDAVQPDHPVFGPWRVLSDLTAEQFAEQAEALCREFADPARSPQLNVLVAELFSGPTPRHFDEVIDRYGRLLAEIAANNSSVATESSPADSENSNADPASDARVAAARQLRDVLEGPDSPASISIEDAERLLRREDRERLRELRGRITEWRNSDKAPRQAMVMVDRDGQLDSPRILVRGNPNNRGDQVPRQFLRLIAGEQRRPFEQGSGRLELARAIADPANPLTARVWVNRVWGHLFGRGLVETPSDFGTRSDPPSHPELLDYLASRFVAEGWSTKKLIRMIVESAAYQQSSAHRDDAMAVDPENRWIWRANRRRLDFEAHRDAMLAVSGSLDATSYGPSVDITSTPFTARRTVYSYIDRQNLPGLFRTFDFASPDTHSPHRYQTTVPQQALFLMNHPFVQEKCRQLISRPELANAPTATERLRRLYVMMLGRSPSDDEVRLGLEFVGAAKLAVAGHPDGPVHDDVRAADQPGGGEADGGDRGNNDDEDEGRRRAQEEIWAQYVQALMMSNEFVFVD